MDSLELAYGRRVPSRVRLTAAFDVPDNIMEQPGDVVDVVPPPEGLERDSCSLFVRLHSSPESSPETERVYEHEFEPVA